MTPQEIVKKINSDDSEVPYEVYADINDFLDDDRKEDALIYLKKYFKCTDDIAKEALMIYIETVYPEHKKIRADSDASLTPEQIARANAVAREWQNKPKCPTCQSQNLKKISATSKVVNTAVWGIFGTKRHKTFHCNNCGYEW